MDKIPQLTTGVCDEIASSTGPHDPVYSTSPTVQVVFAKALEVSVPARWRIVISDGVHVVQAMVVTQLNPLFENRDVGKNGIVRIQRFAINMIQNRRLLIILGLEVLAKEAEKIGNPVPRTMDPPKPPSLAGSSEPQAPHQPSRPTTFIEGLSPHLNNWTIKARVIQKSEIRNRLNQRGEGKIFSVTLMDETGEIRATGFDLVVDQLYDKLQEGKVYYISKARVNLTTGKNELSLERNTEVEECTDQSNVPEIKYDFVKLGELINKPKDTICDVIGIVSKVSVVAVISINAQKTASKRELTLVDRTNSSIRLTLWGKWAETYEDDGSNPVIAFKGVWVGEFQGRSLSMVGSSIMTINPKIPDARVLREWYDAVGVNQSFTAYSNAASGSGAATFNRTDIRMIDNLKANLQVAEEAEVFSYRGTVSHVQGDTPAYPACPNQTCKRKVIDIGEGWHCEKCEKTWQEPEYRYITMAVSDHTEQAWLQACGRLIGRSFAPHELPSLMEAIASSKDERDMTYTLLRDDAQTFIDVTDEALDLPDIPTWVRKKCLQLLYRVCGHHALLPRALKIPVRYDRTRDALYRGGFADVWKGEHGGREVAVKILRTYSNSDFQKIVDMFCKEVVMWKYLRHPNVLSLTGATMSETRFEMVSDWMVNGNISDFVKTHTDVDRYGILVGVAKGLIYIHSEGMIHGDLKGANILIDRTGNARLADFGLLAIISDPAGVLSSTSFTQGGTIRWMGPELLDPERFGLKDSRPTKSSDCYALGMVIHETISGNVPFHEHADFTVYTKVLGGARPARGAGFAERLWRMLKMCWKPRPDDRPTIEEVFQCLREVSQS